MYLRGYFSSQAWGKLLMIAQSGYYNRLLPIPMHHRQPQPHDAPNGKTPTFACEPVWTQLIPQSRSVQYILFWYISETLPPEIEASMRNCAGADPVAYRQPPRFPASMTLAERVAMEPEGYEPIKHEHTAVNAEEAFYESHLLPVEEALRALGTGSTSADVVRRGWAAILLRRELEKSKGDVGTWATVGPLAFVILYMLDNVLQINRLKRTGARDDQISVASHQ